MESFRHSLRANPLALMFLYCGLWACSSSSGTAPVTGGVTNSGGRTATGGITATGGNAVTGGTTMTGGRASGGSNTTGGSPLSGGSGSGGSNATGGSSTGGSATGGAATGGAGQGGSSPDAARPDGASTGGSPADGSVADGSAETPGKTSPGCGSGSPLKTGNFTESIGGTSRKWMLDVPTGYDAGKPYRLIFVWHPLGGSGSQVVSGGFDGLKALANNTAIFATADGLSGSNSETNGVGWWNANGGDMKLFQAMLDKINGGLCVDQERIFSTGFSFGGMMTYTLPFEFDVFRAVAPCSGKTGVIPFTEKFSRSVPIMAFHGDNDTFVATALGKAFFDKYRARNKCGTQTKPVSPSPCMEYQDCVVPTIWCEFPGGHNPWSEEPQAIWKFFSQF